MDAYKFSSAFEVLFNLGKEDGLIIHSFTRTSAGEGKSEEYILSIHVTRADTQTKDPADNGAEKTAEKTAADTAAEGDRPAGIIIP